MQFPDRVGPHRIVAFTHITAGPGTYPVQGIAITRDVDRFNVHSVWLANAELRKWEGRTPVPHHLAARTRRDDPTRSRPQHG